MDPRLEEAAELRRAMVQLKESAGWNAVCEVLRKQVHERHGIVYAPCTGGMDGVIAQEFIKGEAAALELALRIPDELLDDAQGVIDVYEREAKLKEEQEDAA